MGVGWGLPGMGWEGGERGHRARLAPAPGLLELWEVRHWGAPAAGCEDQEPGVGGSVQPAGPGSTAATRCPQTSTSHLILLSPVSCPV